MSWGVSAMRCGISCFSPAFFRKNLARFWPLWSGCTLAVAVMMLTLSASLRWSSPQDVARELTTSCATLMPIGMLCYGLLCGVLLLGYLFSPVSANMVHSFPLRRSALFFTQLCSGLLFALLPLVVGTGLALCLLPGAAGAALSWAGASMLLFLFFFSLSLLSCVLTGTRAAAVILYAALLFGAPVLEAMAKNVTIPLLYGLVRPEAALTALCPPAYLLQRANPGLNGSIPWGYLGAAAGAAALLLGLALALYRTRKSERAGDFMAFRGLAPVFKYLFTFGIGLILANALAYLLDGGFERGLGRSLLWLLAGTLVARLTAELLLTRSARVFRPRVLLSCGLCLALAAGALVLLDLDPAGVERRVPQAQEVASVAVADSRYREGFPMTDPDQVALALDLHRDLIGEKENQEALTLESLPADWRWGELALTYRLRDGSVLQRAYQYRFPPSQLTEPDSLAGRLTQLLNGPEQALARLSWSNQPRQTLRRQIQSCQVYAAGSTEDPVLAQGILLERPQAQALFDSMWRDIQAGALGQAYAYGQTDAELVLALEFCLSVPGDRSACRYFSVDVSADCAAILEYVQDIQAETMDESPGGHRPPGLFYMLQGTFGNQDVGASCARPPGKPIGKEM